ncbi:hypothetical protein BWD09_12115 [Neisseria dentiae]|uniref:Uncharacterized protein n=1 Tax=Neisseria dentiae TaxID=194197 RepID=A0A1X3D2W2_9NEIS|nr:hypothetical protein [Neisseria dentiae]OSI13857.1 hypothetical protein BWD09_12115 [Neisseria dentiae]QMT45689.1 hypothetical protein H3L92_02415 [Neisseria dentiae]STZ51628.1 Uncharacterised protein [Neisseria dentiae]
MNELKKETLALINYLQERDYSIRKLSRILFSRGIFRVQSWLSLKEKVNELGGENDLINKINKVLSDEYDRSLEYGKKAICFFDISDLTETNLQELEDKLGKLIEENKITEYSKYFPKLIPRDILENQSTDLFCISKDTRDENINRFWVCGRKSFRKRREFTLGEAPDEVQDYFRGFDVGLYDELIAIRQDFKQLISYFTINRKDRLITLYSDTTAITSQSDMDYLSETFFAYLVKIYPVLSSAKRKNIGNAIRALYDESLGRVTSFSHYTDSGSVKHERLDRRSAREDLRLETYHVSGMDAIESKTEFHAIEKKWASVSGNDLFEPTISLSYKSFLDGTTKISACYIAEIDDCACQEDLDSLTNKI